MESWPTRLIIRLFICLHLRSHVEPISPQTVNAPPLRWETTHWCLRHPTRAPSLVLEVSRWPPVLTRFNSLVPNGFDLMILIRFYPPVPTLFEFMFLSWFDSGFTELIQLKVFDWIWLSFLDSIRLTVFDGIWLSFFIWFNSCLMHLSSFKSHNTSPITVKF